MGNNKVYSRDGSAFTASHSPPAQGLPEFPLAMVPAAAHPTSESPEISGSDTSLLVTQVSFWGPEALRTSSLHGHPEVFLPGYPDSAQTGPGALASG